MLLGLILSLAIGFSLALLGSGGSIITLPVLVYAARVPAPEAVGMSLAIVGGTTLVASLLNARRGLVHGKAALLFSGTGMAGAYAGAHVTHLVSPSVLLLLFAALMIVVAGLMFRRRLEPAVVGKPQCHWQNCAASGLAVGGLTGFLGVGGGFLIVPALLFFGRLPLKIAIGTSLVVITVNCFAGLVGHLRATPFDWHIAGMFTGFALVGMLAGRTLAARVHPERLRRWFAWFVLSVAVFVIAENWGTVVSLRKQVFSQLEITASAANDKPQAN